MPTNFHYVGTLIGPPPPGFYSVARELGPNAFDPPKPSTGWTARDCTSRNVNKDSVKIGNPGSAPVTDALVERFHAFDSGRAFMSVVSGDGVTVRDAAIERTARNMLNCEPDSTSALGVLYQRVVVGDVNFWAFGSKGNPWRPVEVTYEDIRQIPGTSCGGLMWCAGQPRAILNRKVTMRRVHVRCRRRAVWPNTLDRTVLDPGYHEDELWDTARTTPNYVHLPKFAAFGVATEGYFEDVWVDGRPVTEDDFQWIEGKLTIKHTPGFTPNDIAAPVGVPSPITIADEDFGEPEPPPPPPPPPVDPSCEDALALERFFHALTKQQLAETVSQVADRDAKINAAKEALA